MKDFHSRSSAVAGLCVQYGCGFCAPDGWLNFDASPTLRFERLPIFGRAYTKNRQRFPDNVRYGDIARGLPLPSESCRAVYASHVLEHLALDDFERALAETFRILGPGGVFRCVVPDLQIAAQRYLEAVSAGRADAAHEFMRMTGFGAENRRRGLLAFVVEWLGNSHHLWMWDFESLRAALSRHGFVAIRRAQFGNFEDPAFRAVEDPGRFVDACAVEARKPTAA